MADDPVNAESFSREPQASGSWFNFGIVCLFLSLVFYRTSYTLADHDLWGHVRFGQDTIRARQIVETDPYSYLTTGVRWINHEWLAEVVFALIYDSAGPAGLILLKVAISLVIFGLLTHHLRRYGLSALRTAVVLILVLLPVLTGLQTVRPHLFTYLFFVLVLLLIHEVEHGRRRWLWTMPILFAVWANLHGGFLAGVGILFLWGTARLVLLLRHGRWAGWSLAPAALTTVAVAVLSVLATLCNPYGIELWLFLLRTATVPRPEINEWKPLLIVSVEGVLCLALLGVTSAAVLASRRERNPVLIFLFICMAILPLVAARHLALFALASVVLIAEHLADACERWLGAGTAVGRRERWLGPLFLVAAAALVASSLPNLGCIRLEPSAGFSYPVRAVALLKKSEVKGNLVLDFNWGEYALWHLSPNFKVSLDGRRETVYGDEVYAENLRFFQGVGDWDAILRRPETDLVLVGKDFPAFNLMKLEPGWVLVYEDELCGVFARKGSPKAERLKDTSPPDAPYNGAGTCFP